MIYDDDEGKECVNNAIDGDALILPVWGYILLFLGPASISFAALFIYMDLDLTFSGVIALAVMNGSINSVIAWLTIRLDGHSTDALDHLETIMSEMEKFDQTLSQASEKIESFTTDLDQVSDLFHKVGLDLADLDLAPIAEVVEKLKENKDGLGEVLDNLRTIDVTDYIDQAKRIEWKTLMNSAEQIMGFIQKDGGTMEIPEPHTKAPKLPDLSHRAAPEPTISQILEEMGDDDFFSEDGDFFETKPEDKNTLTRLPPQKLSLKRLPPE